MIPVTVLRSGGEYTPKHVEWLAKQVPGLVCLSDTHIASVPTVPLRKMWPGWWSKIELFSDVIGEDLLFFDLDTVVIGDINELNVGRTTVLKDFYKPAFIGSGMMYIAQADKKRVWDAFNANPEGNMRQHRSFPLRGDQGFLFSYLAQADRWQTVRPGKVVSYKVHCTQELPKDASVVCFHGQPRPWNVTREWIPRL